jgi:hypothetical protein
VVSTGVDPVISVFSVSARRWPHQENEQKVLVIGQKSVAD